MRYELKFRLNLSQYGLLREKIRLLLNPDSHARQGAYDVWSLYYDTRNLDLFFEKVDGEYEHLKLRLRSYADSFDPSEAALFAECKIKYQDKQDKWRQRLTNVGTATQMWDAYGKRYPLVAKLLRSQPLYPTVYVYYRRQAFEGLIGSQRVRINFDTDIAAARPLRNIEKIVAQPPELRKLPLNFAALLEIKVADPDVSPELGRVLKSVGIRQSSFSKYGAALEYIGSERLALGILV